MNRNSRQRAFLENAVSSPPRPRRISRRHFLKILGGVSAGGAAGGWYLFRYAPYHPVVTRRTLALKDLPAGFEGIRIVQVSDLHHSGMVPIDYLERCIQSVNALNPDLVFLTGDYVTMDWEISRDQNIKRFLEPLGSVFGAIRAGMGLYAVMGNHDVAAAFHATRLLMERLGIPLLQDAGLYLERRGDRLALVGLRDFGTQIVDTERAFTGIDPDEPALILMHNPDLFPKLREHRNGLIFAGHTHGGQVRLPFYGPLPNVISSKYGSRFAEGVFRDGDLTMLVNRGLGMIHTPIRLNCRPEISLVTLKRADSG